MKQIKDVVLDTQGNLINVGHLANLLDGWINTTAELVQIDNGWYLPMDQKEQTLKEHIKELMKQINQLKNENLQQMMAVTEVFEQNIDLMEKNAKLQEENTAIMLAMTDLFEKTVSN